MLSAVRKLDGLKVIARAAKKSDAPFFCSTCGDLVALKKGNIKVDHFLHRNTSSCSMKSETSISVLSCKQEIYDGLTRCDQVTQIEVEKPFGDFVADVFAIIRGTPVVIAIKRGDTRIEESIHKMMYFNHMQIHVLWIGIYSKSLEKNNILPSIFEKWMQAAYCGKSYYWTEGLQLTPIQFFSVQDKEEGGLAADQQSTKSSAKIRLNAVCGEALNLASDFFPCQRDEFVMGKITTPNCLILLPAA